MAFVDLFEVGPGDRRQRRRARSGASQRCWPKRRPEPAAPRRSPPKRSPARSGRSSPVASARDRLSYLPPLDGSPRVHRARPLRRGQARGATIEAGAGGARPAGRRKLARARGHGRGPLPSAARSGIVAPMAGSQRTRRYVWVTRAPRYSRPATRSRASARRSRAGVDMIEFDILSERTDGSGRAAAGPRLQGAARGRAADARAGTRASRGRGVRRRRARRRREDPRLRRARGGGAARGGLSSARS